MFSTDWAILLSNRSYSALLGVINDALQKWGLNRSTDKSVRVIPINDGWYYLLITGSN